MIGERHAQMRDEAAAWVARMDGGWDDEKEAELQAWLERDPLHQGALLQMQAAWMTLDSRASARKVARPIGPVIKESSEGLEGPSRRRMLAAGAVAIAASLAGGLVWTSWPTSFATQVGEIRRVPLADGSVATINTASKVEIKLAGAQREVRLQEGEAWFQVARDRSRPFVVEAGRVRVRAVGTAFSVRRYSNGAEVLVTEGIVEAWAAGADGHRARLTAGQKAFIADNAAIRSAPAAPSSVDRALAWRSGKIDLVGQPLSEAIDEFNRYNRRKLVLGDRSLASEQLDGVFRVDDPEGFAVAVRSALSVPVDLTGRAEIRIGEPSS